MHLGPTKPGTIPVSTSPAQIGTLCSLDKIQEDDSGPFDHELRQIKKQNYRLYLLVEFLLSSACRISEALSIQATDITSVGHVKIVTLKKGKVRIVPGGLATEYLRKCYRRKASPWGDWSRFFVYREFKKYGLSTKLKGRSKNTVTHLPRHTVAKGIQSAGMEIEMSRQALGQSSIKSTGYYHEQQ
jgi:site-specific recombinase XerD